MNELNQHFDAYINFNRKANLKYVVRDRDFLICSEDPVHYYFFVLLIVRDKTK